MKRAWSILLLVIIAIIISFSFGLLLESDSPDGIWLHTPHADGAGNPADSFEVGMTIGLALMSLIYVVSGICMYLWAKLKSRKLSGLCIPFIISSVIVLATTVLVPVSVQKKSIPVIFQ